MFFIQVTDLNCVTRRGFELFQASGNVFFANIALEVKNKLIIKQLFCLSDQQTASTISLEQPDNSQSCYETRRYSQVMFHPLLHISKAVVWLLIS